ncbi:probable Choline transport protein [Zygosaccharomyces bailii ISA1307]|nr:probable Choline transport protein [Zygosaccharomyces bailii ISA1307]
MNSGYEIEQSSQADVHKRDYVANEVPALSFDKDDMDKPNQVEGDGNGEEVHLRKSFSLWSILGIGFGLTNSWYGISASLVTGLSSGGPVLLIYGIILVALVSITIGVSLGELSSAYPHAGGQFFWSLQLAPPGHKRFAAYMCGSFAYAGAVFTSASTTLSVATELVAMYALTHNGFVQQRWHVFVTYEILHFFLMLFNCYGKPLPFIASSSLYISLLSFFTITITVLACSSGHFNSAKFVFATFYNETGWKNGGIAFIVGLINPAWSFSCLDCATHMAFEVEKPERVIPIAIMGTVAIGFLTSFCYVISMFFSIRDFPGLMSNDNGFPVLIIYYQALKNKAGAIVLGCMILFTSFGCVISCHTWQSRLCWSFSRDRGLPFSKWWSTVNSRMGVPLNAHLMSSGWVAIIGLLYLASSTAFNSLITACISFLLLSYSIPVICLLMKKRRIPHGPFWFGKFGLVCNIFLLLWTVFCLVFFSFPPDYPVDRNNMNYVSVVLVGIFLYCLAYWQWWGKKDFHVEGIEDESRDANETIDEYELSGDTQSQGSVLAATPQYIEIQEKSGK